MYIVPHMRCTYIYVSIQVCYCACNDMAFTLITYGKNVCYVKACIRCAHKENELSDVAMLWLKHQNLVTEYRGIICDLFEATVVRNKSFKLWVSIIEAQKVVSKDIIHEITVPFKLL